MENKKCEKQSFVVIGKEGSTLDGAGFIQKLWDDANSRFAEVEHLAKKDENGDVGGIWGAMSDFSVSFMHGRTLAKGCILLVWNAMMTWKLLKAGRNGSFPDMNTFMWNAKMMPHFWPGQS